VSIRQLESVVPGIDYYSAMIIKNEIGEIERFPDYKKAPFGCKSIVCRERGISSKTEENDEKACAGCEDVWMHQLDIFLEGYNN
jgi:hypothetical protein